MSRTRSIHLAVCLAGLLAACSDSSSGPSGPVTPARIVSEYAAMMNTVAATLDGAEYFHDSAWHQHYGDGLMFGPSYDLATWSLTGNQANHDRALAVLDHDAELVEGATAELEAAFADLESVAMALLGLLESAKYLSVPRYQESAEDLIAIVDPFVRIYGDYLEIEEGEFAAVTYGPTAISTLVVQAKLAQARYYTGEDAAACIARAEEMLANIHAIAWSDELAAYRFAPEDPRMMLYPNATMMLAYAQALGQTDDPDQAARIATIYEGIQPLRAASGDHYHSPYSREEASAVDEDYATLSSQNYLMLALWLAYEATGEQRYLDEVDRILGWIRSHLFVDGEIKHHWVNGRVASEAEDLYDFCSGCNLQTLYLFRTIEQFVTQGT